MRQLFLTLLSLTWLAASATPAQAARVKDITLIEGGRDNQLVGYGLVVGLANKGDSKSDQIVRTVANSMQRFGINLQGAQLKSDNVAAVMVTADIPAYARAGTRIDVTVGSIADAKTIQGGILLQTPLLGADETVYAVAQGAIAVGGFLGGEGGPGGASVQKNHPTVGIISGGALVEREIPASFVHDNNVELMLLNPDYTSAARMAQAINQEFPQSAMAKNASTVNIAVPDDFKGYEVNFISRIGSIEVDPDVPARVVINERTGTIVATSNVRVSTVAISHGALTISIASTLGVSQPNPLSRGVTAVVASTQTDIVEKPGKFGVLEDNPTIQQVASALNALGLTTREMMSIFQTMKRAGALQAELILN
ncbi:MAG: flagellar basal body P-ring protein FlgI [Verrucomicrobiota bacterium]